MIHARVVRHRPHARVISTTSTRTTSAAHPWPVRDEILTLRDVTLESGERLPTLSVHFRLEGSISPARDNVVLVIHALTGTVRATEWWAGVIEANGAIDPHRHAVLTANLLGGCDGTTIPFQNDLDAAPAISTRDQAAVLALLLEALGVSQPLLVCGGSLGGQVALEFAASFPARVRAVVVLAAPATQTAQGLAWNAIMRRAIAIGGSDHGLALARMVGMISYRTPEALERRFGRARNGSGNFQMNDWLDAHGDRLVARFDAASYTTLIDAMDTHDIGRNRGGVASALAPIAQRLTGVGIPGDLLYPAETVREWTTATGAHYVDLPSIHGHDAFLLETEKVSAIVRAAIERAEAEFATSRSVAPAAPPSRTTLHVTASVRIDAERQPPIRVALAGCGHVGGSVLDLLSERRQNGRRVRVDKVLVRDPRERPALARAFAQGTAVSSAPVIDPSLLLDEHTDVFIEAIGGTTTARTLVETALTRGIRVITANKALLAERGPQLQALAQANGTRIDFEGAVAAAIPVIRCIRSGAVGVGITECSGILNGTSNFVLDRVADGATLADAIALAQQHGYAEADPTRDLSGEDAEDKLRVLAWLLFGVDPADVPVVRRGIDAETASWAARVARDGDRVKLIATCTLADGQLVARVAPTRVSGSDPWAQVGGPGNRIVITSASAGEMVFHGAGAGGRATAGAVLGDLWS